LFQWNVLVANGLIHEVLVELNPILIKHLLWNQPICDSARNEFLFFFNGREFSALQGALHRLRLSSLNIIAIHMLSLSFLIERLSNLGHLALILPNLSHSSSFNDLRVDALCIIKILDIDIGLRNTSMMMHARIIRARILIINDLDLNWEPGLLVHAYGRVPQVFYLLVQLLEDEGHLLLVAEEVG
jgi:hypothetical protein